MPDRIWNAAEYTRLSRDDGDKAESNSITSQKEIIRGPMCARHPEFVIVKEYADDGYSGVNFERPGFKQMMEDIKAKKIDCVICKDLSRFARNYIDAGRYLEKIFPFMGVRFIAINDNYDSCGEKAQSDALIVPFKNLINDAYCGDISVKIRSQLDIKRKMGDFIGAFAPWITGRTRQTGTGWWWMKKLPHGGADLPAPHTGTVQFRHCRPAQQHGRS